LTLFAIELNDTAYFARVLLGRYARDCVLNAAHPFNGYGQSAGAATAKIISLTAGRGYAPLHLRKGFHPLTLFAIHFAESSYYARVLLGRYARDCVLNAAHPFNGYGQNAGAATTKIIAPSICCHP